MQILELKRLDPEGRTVEKVPGVRMTANGLVFDKALTIEQWKEVGRMLKAARTATLWWEADWMQYGKASYEETDWDEAVDQLEFDFVGGKYDLLMSLAAVPIERRRPGLSAQHYLFLTKLPTVKEQDKWAKVAEVEKPPAEEEYDEVEEVEEEPPTEDGTLSTTNIALEISFG